MNMPQPPTDFGCTSRDLRTVSDYVQQRSHQPDQGNRDRQWADGNTYTTYGLVT